MEAEDDGRDGVGLTVVIEEGVMEQETWKRQAGSQRHRAEVTFRSGCRCRGQVQSTGTD